MKLVPVDTIPAPKKKLQQIIDDFINSPFSQVEIVFEPDDYRNFHSCYSSFYKAIKVSGYGIRIASANSRIFLEKHYTNKK